MRFVRWRLGHFSASKAFIKSPVDIPLRYKPWQQFLVRFRFAQVAREDAGREGEFVFAKHANPHPRHLYRHWPIPGQHLRSGK